MTKLEQLRAVGGLHQKIVDDVPKLKRGTVWCLSCNREMKVDSAECLARGWPKCCGSTMTIDSPRERGDE